MSADTDTMRIDVMADGPYIVTGNVPLIRMQLVTDPQGDVVDYKEVYRYPLQETYMLCRCGRSKEMPFCDGSHMEAGFKGNSVVSSATRYADNVEAFSGDGIQLLDANTYCIGARFCDRAGSVWALTQRSADNPRYKETAIEEAMLCPSGRLIMADIETKELMEPTLEPSIVLLEDPSRNCSSALWVCGGIPIFGSDGEQFEHRNRVTLCRCGQSTNKPFCDARHYLFGFDDGHIEN